MLEVAHEKNEKNLGQLKNPPYVLNIAFTDAFNIIITSTKHIQASILLVPQHTISQEKIRGGGESGGENHLVNVP